jgi:hypothetical protein
MSEQHIGKIPYPKYLLFDITWEKGCYRVTQSGLFAHSGDENDAKTPDVTIYNRIRVKNIHFNKIN